MSNHINFTGLQELAEIINSEVNSEEENVVVSLNYIITLESKLSGKSKFSKLCPNRMNCLRLVFVQSGWLESVVNMQKITVREDELIFLNWGTIIESVNKNQNGIVSGVVLTEDYLKEIFSNKIPFVFQNPNQTFILKFTAEEKQIFRYYLITLIKLTKINKGNDIQAIRSLFVSLLQAIETSYEKKIVEYKDKHARSIQLSESFATLAIECAKERRSLSYYASRLCVTPHHLSRIVKEEMGESAKVWLDKTLLNSIKLELKYGNKSLKEIAYEFRFESFSSFCKFFKRHTGLTAGEFRNK